MVEDKRQKARLLIVDDDPDILKSFKLGLEQYGYTVDAYQDPEIALRNFQPNQYDLLLIDILMPKMDGFKFFQEVQKVDPAAKACFVTAYEQYFEGFREIFPDLEVGSFIKKPVRIADLASQVKRHVIHD